MKNAFLFAALLIVSFIGLPIFAMEINDTLDENEQRGWYSIHEGKLLKDNPENESRCCNMEPEEKARHISKCIFIEGNDLRRILESDGCFFSKNGQKYQIIVEGLPSVLQFLDIPEFSKNHFIFEPTVEDANEWEMVRGVELYEIIETISYERAPMKETLEKTRKETSRFQLEETRKETSRYRLFTPTKRVKIRKIEDQ